ncbi:MAG: glycosyltransferase family 39 protein [Acidobacteriota bacterium]|nr:glycosyltransferase family 39 protein [Acidobacteriota bacterium]
MFPHRTVGDVHSSSFANHLRLSLPELFTDRRFHFGLIAVMAFLVLFSKLHIGDLGGYDDAVYAHEGKQMLATNQWWSVYLNGHLDFDKPPLFVWLEAVSMWIFGVTDFAARFPSALLGFGTILLVYFLASELSDSYRLPVWAMLVLLCTQEFVRFSMRAMTDVPFTFFFLLAILAYLKGLKQPKWFLLLGMAVSLAILTRSYLGLIPLGIVLAHSALTRRIKPLLSGWFLTGLTIAIGLPMIWFVSQYQLHGAEFLTRHFSFTVENLPMTDSKDAVQFQSGLFQYPIFLLQSYWPWLPLLVAGLALQIRKLVKTRDSTSVLLVVWVLAVIVPFSLIHYKWLRYILPVFPAFSILAAMPICQWLEWRPKNVFPSVHLKILYVLLGLLMIGMAINPKYRDRPEELRRLAPLAESVTSPERRILLYTERAPRDAHLFQLIWYANRHCELLNESREVFTRLASHPKSAVIMDKDVFNNSVGKVESGVEVLGETEGFVCWTINGSFSEKEIPADTVNNASSQFTPSVGN